MRAELLPLFPTVGYLLLGLAGRLDRNTRPRFLPLLAEAWALSTIAIAVVTFILLYQAGPQTVGVAGLPLAAISARIDMVSATMLLLVSFIGWIVVRYSAVYLDGERRQRDFICWLCVTLASVLLLMVAGNLVLLILAWMATSLCLQRLLLFYPDRPGAQRAARKKFLTARIGDIALIGAAAVLASRYGTGDIAEILAAARASTLDASLVLAASLIALAAMLKSAQFPTHGWLTEVMETPTPVSALLHAGIINAGGFLLIRFADVVVMVPAVLAALVMVGGFTALFGGLVMLTQPAVKTSLAWSTVSQMGFMVFECGLALFPLALLHIVAHSLYKAHSFLAAGGAVERVVTNRRPGPVAIPDVRAVGRAFAAALGIYATVALGFRFDHQSPQALALGAILIFGVAYLLAQGFAGAAPRALAIRTAAYALAASLSYFALQSLAFYLTRTALPATPAPGPLEWGLIVLALASFGTVALAQSTFPLWAYHPAAAGLRVHLSNGCYVNAALDRLLGSWRTRRGLETFDGNKGL